MKFKNKKKKLNSFLTILFIITILLSLLLGMYYGRYHPDTTSKFFLPIKIIFKNISSPQELKKTLAFSIKNNFNHPPSVDISIKQDVKDQINNQLNDFKNDVLLKHKIKSLNGEIYFNGKSYKIKFRLKGRLPDHRNQNNRISLNINLAGNSQILSK